MSRYYVYQLDFMSSTYESRVSSPLELKRSLIVDRLRSPRDCGSPTAERGTVKGMEGDERSEDATGPLGDGSVDPFPTFG